MKLNGHKILQRSYKLNMWKNVKTDKHQTEYISM